MASAPILAVTPQNNGSAFFSRSLSRPLTLALFAMLAGMHLSMAFGRAINWDEFFFYGQVEMLARGEFLKPLQTIHTRLFVWIAALPGDEVDHIIVARLFMLASLGAIGASIYGVASKFTDKQNAALCSAAYLGAGLVLQHGTSFRVDPMAAALLSLALLVLARSQMNWFHALAMGALCGLAAMVTIKVVLWLPAFAAVGVMQWHERGWDKGYVVRVAASVFAAAASFASLYAFHSMGADPDQANAAAQDIASSSIAKMFGFFNTPYLIFMVKGALTAIILAIGIVLVPFRLAKIDAHWTRRLAIAGLFFPILTPFFYHNSAPYLYTFILPPVAMACALSMPVLTKRYGAAAVAAIIALNAAAVWIVDERGMTGAQQEVIGGVHEIFPEPVSYFDCCSMVSTFSKSNTFRTPWGIERYLASGRPAMLEAMQTKPVPLLLANDTLFTGLFDGDDAITFHPDDAAALRNTYIPLWGDVFVAGKIVSAGDQLTWNVLVPGTYTVEGNVLIDGVGHTDGDLVQLDRGDVKLENRDGTEARLLWGAGTKAPSRPFPEEYWTLF
ncbi:hypothetical protein AMC99_01730 [Altererythrobacter epoxidivorans]|uniref:Glycosyltransferase RgtA/B/C/D-like domain-containing protein n=1 Tax=Altererythrobacter epoxidivorans TaxID=361183 RepID=A0A0M4MU97_9SPHN|nr:hypothetical protein [Altererythrobacter epoxidivorans]ALE17020.1 hypothetical protein AMC99_01730 [Altererythrobacter epoxidivorans]